MGEYAMALTTFGIFFLIGATFGVRSNVLILFLAIGLVVVGTAGVGIAHGDHVGAVTLTIALVAAALQIGYLSALVAGAVISSLGVLERKSRVIEKFGLR
jgi:hypothetical protein